MPVNTRRKNYEHCYLEYSESEYSESEYSESEYSESEYSSYSESELIIEDNTKTVILPFRSRLRLNGKICISAITNDIFKPVPLEDFIDSEGYFTNSEVCKRVNEWNATASKYPNIKRRCLFCNRKANKGLTICWACKFKGMEEIVYA